MRISGSGNVGIGTTSPSHMLVAKGVAGTSPIFEMINSDTEDTDTGRETSLRYSGFRSGGEAVVNAQISGHHGGSSDDDKGLMLFYVNNGSGIAEMMRIEDDGKVGIGTDAPAYNLDVRSTAATMNLSSTNGNATIYFNKSDINKGAVLVFQKAGGDLWRQGAFAHGGGSKDDYAIKNSVTGTGHCFVIDTGDDNVGIQTYAPAYTLDVDGNIGYSGTITDYSLRRIKENIEEVPVGIIDKFKKLPIYTFNKKVKVDANLIKDAVVNEFGQRRWDLLYPSGSHHGGNLWNCSDGEIKTFIDDFAEEQRVDGRRDIMWQKTSKHYGLIADDDILEQEFPELVGWKPKYYYNEESGSSMKDKTQPEKFGIKTDSYVGMLHAVVKELVTKVESLEAQVSGSR